jgi:hypothetical protein
MFGLVRGYHQSSDGIVATDIVPMPGGIVVPYYIDFVQDCGADPTGVADCAPACDRAFALLSELVASGPATGNVTLSAVLKFPPGMYTLKTTPTIATWNLTSAGTELILEGCGDASVISFAGNGAFIHWPNIVVERFVARDFAVYGADNSGGLTVDCDYCFGVSIVRLGNFERVHFVNVLAQDQVCFLTGGDWAWNDTSVEDCGAVATACLFVTGVTSFVARHFRFYDVGKLNQLTISGKPVVTNARYFEWTPGGVQARTIRFENGFIDELCTNCVALLGTAALPLLHAVFEDCGMNPPTAGGSIILVQHCANVDVSNYAVGEPLLGGFNPNSTSPILDLQSVNETYVVDASVVDAAKAVRILADASCGALEVDNPSDNIVVVSQAAATTVSPTGFVAPNDFHVALTAGV